MLPTIDYQNPRTPLESAMVAALREMTARGHPKSTQLEYSRIWRHLLLFAAERGKYKMCPELGEEFLNSIRATEGAPRCRGKKRMARAIRAVRVLRHFVSHGVWNPYQASQLRWGSHVLPILDSDSPRTPLESSVVKALGTMKSLGYSDWNRYVHSCVWKNLLAFAEKTGKNEMSAPLGEQFLEAYEAAGKKNGICPKSRMNPAQRAVRSLTHFAEYGTWEPFHPRKEPPILPPALAVDLEVYLEHLESERSVCTKTQAFRRQYLHDFLVFLRNEDIRGWNKLKPSIFTTFFGKKMYMQPASLEGISGVLRDFFRFIFASGRLDQDWSSAIPHFRSFADQKVPAIWTRDMVESLLRSVPRDSPQGKRDRAILLLACRLGMRTNDIRTLRLESLRWDDSRIEYTQTKTGKQMILPLTNEVGEALIDYLLNGRPTSACREVFLRSKPPYRPLSRNLAHIINKHRRDAKLAFPGQHAGMHSLRHTVASQLLANGTSLETIAEVLGHASLNSTRIYTKVDIKQLRTAALDPEEVYHA
jgi:site-specific recombinase XerD